MAPAGSQQLRVQDLAPARRCSTEGRLGHQGWEGGNSDGHREGGGDAMGARTEAGTGARTRTRIEMRLERRESLGTYEVVMKVGRKTQEGGRC